MKLKKLLIIAVAAFLLVGASEVMARVVSGWVVIGLDSSSGTVTVESDTCIQAVAELRQQGFLYRNTVDIETRVNGLIFQSTTDNAILYCLFNVFEEQGGLFGEEIQ